MSFSSSQSDEQQFQVEICATLLTDKPPKLPLREELPSLGFEIIYNGRGVGERTSRYEAKRAVEHYRREEQVKDLKKRRIFPKSAKKIRDKLLERRRVEMELKMPHAFSYESYEHQLYDEVETTSSSSGASSGNNPAKIRHDQRKLVRGRKLFGMFRRSKSADDDVMLPTSIRINKDEQTLDDILSVAAFDDVLAESQDDIRVFPTTNKSTGKDTVTTVFSGGTSAGLLSGTFVNGKRRDDMAISPSNMEIQFVSSPLVEKFLPGLTTVKEATGLDASIADAFVNVNESKALQDASEVNSARAAFEDLSSSVYEGMNKAPRARETAGPAVVGTNTGFVNVFEDSVDGRNSEIQQKQASAISGCGISSAVCNGATASGQNTQKSDGWLHSALRSVLAKNSSPKETMHTTSDNSKMIEFPEVAVSEQASRNDLEDLARSFSGECGIKPTHPGTNKLSDVLTSEGVSVESIEEIIKASPSLLRSKRDSDARMPLHVICGRVLPNRTSIEASELTKALVFDIDAYKQLIEKVLQPHPSACLEPDSRDDLPVHLLARNLMQWEATWYERVYAQAASEGEDPSGSTSADISRLYKMMSRTVEMILFPVASDPKLCQKAGSVGAILPLHIASIFTSSVRTLRKIAEAYPEAANRPCDLGRLRTFVPDKSKPLELHEGLSTDFPKWEDERTLDSDPEISWSQGESKEASLEDQIRRSDVLFAFNPSIEPFRFDKQRIRRLEALISYQTKAATSNDVEIPRAIQLLWSWMCTFQEDKSLRPTYVKSVQRIVSDLPHRAIRTLAAIKVDGGRTVLSTACPQCAKIIRDALCDNVWDEDTGDAAWEGFQPPKLDYSWRREAALLCRSLFNVKEEVLPTSFVILPYKLVKQNNGTIALHDESSLELASKFAASLLHMTDPRSILYFLDMKSIRYFDQSIYESSGDDETVRLRTYSKIRELEAALLGLYSFNENAYLYLVDEVNGVPIVPGPGEGYPFVLKEPASMVRKLLPLMLLGMVMMRGDKTLSVLVNVLLDVCVTKVPSNWIPVARDLRSNLDNPEATKLERFLNLKKLKADLSDFLSAADLRRRLADNPKNGSTEWNVELSILKMLFEMHDKSNLFCGLERSLVPRRGVVWIRSDEAQEQQSSASFPDLGERWDSASTYRTDGVPAEDGVRDVNEERETVPRGAPPRRIPTLEEVRQKCDAIRSSRVPDLDELSRKHDELTRKFGNMNLRDPSDDEESAEIPVQSVKIGRKRPSSLQYDDSSSMRVVNVNYDSSHSSEAIDFPQPQNDSSDEEARRFPTQRPTVWNSDDSETSDDALLRRSRLLLQRSHSQDLAAKPTAGTDCSSSTSSSSSSHRRIQVDPFETRERHSLLFQALAFDPPQPAPHPVSPRDESTRPAPSSSASTVVHQDIMSQLDRSPVQQDDRELIMLKVRLAQEAKKLEDIHRRVSVAERQELLLVDRERELRSKLLASHSPSRGGDECDGTDPTLVRARSLLVRLCALEDRLLFNQIELQHIKLEAYSLKMEIDELNAVEEEEEADAGFDPAPIATCQSDDYVTRNRFRWQQPPQARPPQPQLAPQAPLSPTSRPKVRFAVPTDTTYGGSLPDDSQCSSSAMMSEIHLLPDDLSAYSATSSTRPAVPQHRRPRQPNIRSWQ